jgi:hypothetical protein
MLRPAPGENSKMIEIDPAWQGDVKFYELVYGTWLTYIFLVLMWERVLRATLPEWKYVLITFLGASMFWINHYFQNSPFYLWLLNGYSLIFLVVYYYTAVSPQDKGTVWKILATLSAIVFTVAFIAFEYIARLGVQAGINEFWFMAAAYFGFLFLIWWRGARRAA